MQLTNTELMNVTGGGMGWLAGLGAAITLICGIIDGYLRPLKCNK